MKKLLIWLLVLSMILPAAGSAYENVSDWAEEELAQAEAHGLLTGTLLEADVTRPITRLEFCVVVMRLYERLAGQREIPVGEAFSDSDDIDVRRAAALGIVNGVNPGVFAPDAPVEKQQLAVMLCRALSALGWQPNQVETPLFSDDKDILPYARENVYYLRALDILRGDDRNRMGAEDRVSVEQAVILALRVYQLAHIPSSEGTDRLTIGLRSAWLGMTETELTALFGAPEERLASGRGYVWQVYGAAEGYRDFFLAGLWEGKVAALYGAGPGFSYPAIERDVKMAQGTSLVSHWAGYQVTQFHDNTAEGKPLCAVWLESAVRGAPGATEDLGRVSFHLANAYRSGNNLPPLGWSDSLAAAAAEQASHMAWVGSVSEGAALSDRLTDAGVLWSAAGENLGMEEAWSLPSLHNGWINRSPDREYLSSTTFAWFGAAVAAGRDGRIFAVQILCEN